MWVHSAVEETSQPGGAWELLEEFLLEHIATDLARSHPAQCGGAPGEKDLGPHILEVCASPHPILTNSQVVCHTEWCVVPHNPCEGVYGRGGTAFPTGKAGC